MSDTRTSKPVCPYCIATIEDPSKDHIFPQFLGGKRKVICCKICNSVFGHTFEADAARVLQAVHVFISSWGVPLRSVTPIWKGAYTKEGETYDLLVGERGTVLESTKPVIELNEDGRLSSGKFQTKKQAERVVRNLIEKGKASENIRIEEILSTKVFMPDLGLGIYIGPEIRRLALKMCIGLSTLFPNFDLEEVAEARLYLKGDPRTVPVNNVVAAFASYDAIDSLRKALSHVIYVERTQTGVYGLVQFFGTIQLFCRVGIQPIKAQGAALLATLDPITGDETFTESSLLNLTPPPYFYSAEEAIKLADGWIMKLGDEARKRGSNPTDLRMSSVEFHDKMIMIEKTNNEK